MRVILATLTLAFLAGCVQTNPVPGYARAGDVIVIGLGGIERNSAGAQSLRPSDLDITITDSAGTSFNVSGQQIFRSYPDHAAFMNLNALQGGELGLVPFDGGWFTTAYLIDGDGAPLPLATGNATVSVTSAKINNTAHPWEGDLGSLSLEILPGQTNLDSDYLRQFVGYAAAATNFLIAPDSPLDGPTVAGAFIKLDYYDDSIFFDGREPIIVPSSHNPYVQLSYKVIPNGNGTGSINIMVLNPEGFDAGNATTANASNPSDLAVRMVYFASGSTTPAIAKTVFSLDSSASYYIATDGAMLDSLTPVLTHATDL